MDVLITADQCLRNIKACFANEKAGDAKKLGGKKGRTTVSNGQRDNPYHRTPCSALKAGERMNKGVNV